MANLQGGTLVLGLLLLQVVVIGAVDCEGIVQERKPWYIKESSAYKLFSQLDITRDGALQWGEWHSNVLTGVEVGHGKSERDLLDVRLHSLLFSSLPLFLSSSLPLFLSSSL